METLHAFITIVHKKYDARTILMPGVMTNVSTFPKGAYVSYSLQRLLQRHVLGLSEGASSLIGSILNNTAGKEAYVSNSQLGLVLTSDFSCSGQQQGQTCFTRMSAKP